MNGDQWQERWRQREKRVKVPVSSKEREEKVQNVVDSSARDGRGKGVWFGPVWSEPGVT